jgi:hypothetical protein
MSKIWLLFDNGNFYTVNCSVYPPKPGSPKPADAFIVSESEGDFTIAARNAAHAAYTRLKLRGEKISPQIAGIELSERTNASANIVGESGGLSFAIAFAKTLLKLDIPDVAATGVITAEGTIEKVNGVDTKLETAANRVNENGFVFYPKKNGYNIPDDLRSIFRQKQIKCHPVDHIDQVFNILMPSPKQTGAFRKIILIVLALIIAVASVHYFFTNNNEQDSPPPKKEIIKPVELKPVPLSVPVPVTEPEKTQETPPEQKKVAPVPVKTAPEDNKGFD